MRDEMDDRIWRSGHDDFSRSVGHSLDELAAGFERLHRIGFAAPWRRGKAKRTIGSRGGLGLLVFAGVALLAFGAGAEPAQAEAPGATRLVVSHADLNLGAAAGRAALEPRIRRAARQLCAPAGPLDARSAGRARRCRDAAIASAQRQIEAAIIRQRAAQLASRSAAAGE